MVWLIFRRRVRIKEILNCVFIATCSFVLLDRQRGITKIILLLSVEQVVDL